MMKKAISLLYLLLLCFLISGCGIKVDTTLTLDSQFKGSRTIVCTAAKKDINNFFEGDISKIDAILESQCPNVLTYVKTEDDSSYIYNFQLTFESIKEYETALGTILNRAPTITYDASDSVFKEGIQLKEDFTSLDLMKWFTDVVEKEKLLDSTKIKQMWEVKDSKVIYQDKTIPALSPIDINTIDYTPLTGINIYTEELDLDAYSRTIEFHIPTASLDKKAAEIKSFFMQDLPEDFKNKWTPNKNGKIYSITYLSDSVSDLEEKTNKVLRSNENNGATKKQLTPNSFFEFDINNKERLDFSAFVGNSSQNVPIHYYYKPHKYSKLKTNLTKDSRDFYTLYSGNYKSMDISIDYIKTQAIDSYSIETLLKEGPKLERTSLFSFNSILSKEEIQLLLSTLEKKGVTDTTFSTTFEKGITTLYVVQAGDIDALNSDSIKLFGPENTISYKRSKNPFFYTQKASLQESINFSKLFGEHPSKATGSYTFYQKTNETIKSMKLIKPDSKDGTLNQPKAYYTTPLTQNIFTFAYEGAHINRLSLLWYFLIAVLVIVPFFFHKQIKVWLMVLLEKFKKRS